MAPSAYLTAVSFSLSVVYTKLPTISYSNNLRGLRD